jgi:hypothetical protein
MAGKGKLYAIACYEDQEGKYKYSSTLSLTSALGGGEWSASRPGRFAPGKKTRYPLYRRLGGPQGWYRRVWKISPPPRFCRPRGESLYRLSSTGFFKSGSQNSNPCLGWFVIAKYKTKDFTSSCIISHCMSYSRKMTVIAFDQFIHQCIQKTSLFQRSNKYS